MSHSYKIDMLDRKIRSHEKRRDELVAQAQRTIKRNQYNERKARSHRLYQIGELAEAVFGDQIIGKSMLDIELYFESLKSNRAWF